MSILNSPIQINGMKLKNRLVMPPMATAKSTEDGKVSQALCDYYKEKSAGGHIGLIITEHSYISQEGKASSGQLSIADNSDIDGLRELVSVIHNNGTKVVVQINHVGGAARYEVTGCEAIGPSAVAIPRPNPTGIVPREMNVQDIEKVIDDFTKAAVRAKAAGFDGVEIHSSHGYFLNQFFSPLTNKRTDQYGGTLEGRIRLHLEIIESIRRAVGKDYLIALRLGASDYMDGGAALEDSIFASKEFEKAGVDLIDISGGLCGYMRAETNEPGYFRELTYGIKKNVTIPVILTGGIVDADSAEKLLKEEQADLIGVGRAILSDSTWAEKAMQTFTKEK